MSIEISNRIFGKRGHQLARIGVAMLTGFAFASTEAQPARTLVGEPTCASCRIEVTKLFTLDNGPDNTLLEDWPASISMDSRGRIALAVAGGKGLAVLFDSTGRNPTRIGKVGSGPNEYQWPAAVAFGAGDTLYVFDLGLSRRTELVGKAQLVKSMQYLGRSVLLRMLPTNEMLVVSNNRFHLYSRGGSLIRDWGVAFATSIPGAQPATKRISNVVANKFWSVNSETYELEQWSLDGTRLGQVKRVAHGFESKRPFSNGMRGTEPSAYVADLRVDRGGRLWVLINVPSKNWKDALGPVDNKRGFTSYPNVDFGVAYESLVEVIDVPTKKLLQSTRVPAYLRFFVSDSRLAALRHSEDGSPVVDVWRVGMKTIP